MRWPLVILGFVALGCEAEPSGGPASYAEPAYDPDETPRGISRADLELPTDASVLDLILTATFGDDTCSGEVGVEVEMLGGVGFGPIATWEGQRR